MKRLKILLFLVLPLSILAQKKIDFKDSMDDAVKDALKKSRSILVVIESPNMKIEKMIGLNDPEVVDLINSKFTSVRMNFIDQDARALIKKYPNINKYPAFVFLHPNNDLFFYDYGNWNSKTKYVDMIHNALNATTQKTLAMFESDYQLEKTNIQALTAFINARKKTGITNNADLIEQYANLLKVSDFKNYETVRYILEAGPYLDGNAFKLAKINQKLVDSIYKTEPLSKRIAINNAIINNTMALAIKTKNHNKAYLAANFSGSTWGKDYQKGARASSSELLKYYKAINDTAQYFRNAINFYDNYYMTISADSIRKLEAKSVAEMSQRMKANGQVQQHSQISKEKLDSLIKSGRITQTVSSFTTVSPALSYANELNNVSSYFYKTGTKNPAYLTKALIWTRRAIELKPIWGYYSTLAHIYYALGIFNEALATQKTAIEMLKQSNRQPEELERLQQQYGKMKDKSL